MIVIADDTFKERYKFNDVEFLKKEKYKNLCKVRGQIKNTDLNYIVSQMNDKDLFCCHKSLQLFDRKGKPLKDEQNDALRNRFLKTLREKGVLIISFSGSYSSNFEVMQIDKNLLYNNLQTFLDYYAERKEMEIKILFFGKNFKAIERNTAIKKLFKTLRETDVQNLKSNKQILEGLNYLYTEDERDKNLEVWTKNNWTKKEIRDQINEKIAE